MIEVHSLFDLSGKVAMVTGGGSGFGREFCNVLAEFGAAVVCTALHMNRAEETCEMLNRYGHDTLAIQVDVSKYDQVRATFKQVADKFGRLDILVNNAGTTTRSALTGETDVGEWHKVLDVNLNGVFYCLREGLGIMMKRKRGSIINIASIVGVTAMNPDIHAKAPYGAAKAAVIWLTKQAAAEYAQHGIRINCIAPGWHSGTRLVENAGIRLSEQERKIQEEAIISRTPMKRIAKPEELKGLLLYLASDSSSFVTGQIIANDGGWTCW